MPKELAEIIVGLALRRYAVFSYPNASYIQPDLIALPRTVHMGGIDDTICCQRSEVLHI